MNSQRLLVLVLLGLLLAPGLCLAGDAWESGHRALIEADWIARDAAAVASLGLEAEAAERFSLARTVEVLGGAQRLAERFQTGADQERLRSLAEQIGALKETVREEQEKGMVSEERRRGLYLEARWLARSVAFANPLLDFEKLLFIKRHDARGVFHMCDQFYGCNAVPGGGLFVLEGLFGNAPRAVNLLGSATVEQGRLKGKRLEGGSFLSPELSFDGRSILFAYSEAAAFAEAQGKETYQWGPEISYHIFGVQADGAGLVQLTDGNEDDFDPCFLPNGRVAFISERRGGYLRCGRHCPVYTLFSMARDGTGIKPLSYHETHEWQPSVANDGTLVYTRWDYVDRDTNIAHHIWSCFPDGRDPRSLHGNYPEKRESRPWMEMDIRAIPGTNSFVATTGSHHGHAFGSLVRIDVDRADDGSMSQLVRLTPEVPFPEAEAKDIARHMIYGTAWPLGLHDYLCAYDPEAKNHGIYWIDDAGNRELLYRDPEIASVCPIPMRPRPVPPLIPEQTVAEGKEPAAGSTGTIAIMNMYNSDFNWPEGVKVDALRIIQLLPKSTPSPNEPRIGVAEQTNARAVLGTVPVEADGSAFFEAPAGKPIYFQALDGDGLAVQSMRSVTYLHPGERLTCLGCHEPKRQAPLTIAARPLALQRRPSRIRPEAEGSNPFSYVRLVQPVLDKHCVECHAREKAVDLSGTIEGKHGWSRSYSNLAGPYGFYFDVANGSINRGVHGGSRTIAGEFGASAAKLTRYLSPEHHEVRLSAEERRRITLWLDSNSEFFGTYENTSAQSRGEVVHPVLE